MTLLRKSLKSDLNPMSLSQKQIPLAISLRRKIKDLQEKIDQFKHETDKFQEESSNKLMNKHDELDKLQRKLRNYILNINFRRNQIEIEQSKKSEPGEKEDLQPLLYEQETVSQSLYQEFE